MHPKADDVGGVVLAALSKACVCAYVALTDSDKHLASNKSRLPQMKEAILVILLLSEACQIVFG